MPETINQLQPFGADKLRKNMNELFVLMHISLLLSKFGAGCSVSGLFRSTDNSDSSAAIKSNSVTVQLQTFLLLVVLIRSACFTNYHVFPDPASHLVSQLPSPASDHSHLVSPSFPSPGPHARLTCCPFPH